MIARQKERYGWEFVFLGANMDAAKEAERFGISADRAMSYKNDSVGVSLNYEVLGDAVCCMRRMAMDDTVPPTSADEAFAKMRQRIDDDVKKRGK